MEDTQVERQEKPHPAETTRVLAALAAMAFWAVGVSLMDPRFGVGAFLCVVSIIWTLWLYWSDIFSIPRQTWRKWPWLGLVIIAIEVIVPCWLFVSKSWGATEQAAIPPAKIYQAPLPPLMPPRPGGLSNLEIIGNGKKGSSFMKSEGATVLNENLKIKNFDNVFDVNGGSMTNRNVEAIAPEQEPKPSPSKHKK